MIREAVFGRLPFHLRIGLKDLLMPGKTQSRSSSSYCKRDLSFEAFWCLIPQRGMESLAVVVVLDELCDVFAQVLEISIFICTDFFLLQSLHEALAPGVVPGIRKATHACDDLMLIQNLPVFGRGVLNASI